MKKTIFGNGLSFLAALLLLSGCSTILGRGHDEQMIFFDASTSGVEVVCSGKRAMTPGSLPLRQSKDHACTAQKEGYEKKAFKIPSGISWSGFGHSTATNSAAWGWWTLGIGTGVGWLVDLPSGAMKNLKEDSLYLEMKPSAVAVSPDPAVLDKTIQNVSTQTARVVETAQPKGQAKVL